MKSFIFSSFQLIQLFHMRSSYSFGLLSFYLLFILVGSTYPHFAYQYLHYTTSAPQKRIEVSPSFLDAFEA